MSEAHAAYVRDIMRATGQSRRAAQEVLAHRMGYETYTEMMRLLEPEPEVKPEPKPKRVRNHEKNPYHRPVRQIDPVDGAMPVATRALIFFTSCPDIEMSTKDMRVKFGLHERCSLNRYLYPLLRRNVITRRIADHTSFYKAGPALLRELGDEV